MNQVCKTKKGMTRLLALVIVVFLFQGLAKANATESFLCIDYIEGQRRFLDGSLIEQVNPLVTSKKFEIYQIRTLLNGGQAAYEVVVKKQLNQNGVNCQISDHSLVWGE